MSRPSLRLVIEERIVALLAILGLVQLGAALGWIVLTFGRPSLAQLTEPGTLAALGAIAVVALLGSMTHVAVQMPARRWPAAPGTAHPSPWPLAAFGAPSLLLWPLLALRDRRATTKPNQASAQAGAREEDELAFRELLAIPRGAALSFGSWFGAASLAVLFVLGRGQDHGLEVQLLAATLVIASLLPLISAVATRVRAMLVPEYLSAPRPSPLALPLRHSLVLRLGGPAGLALFGAVLVPGLVGSLWLDVTMPAGVWLAIISLGLTTGVAAVALLLRDVERDLGRASRQIRTVAEGQIPEPMAVETFATAELRELVAAVDRLVGRITDANVHKYVLIEKGHEADRLKSQFLANMSHDLRSPLNSVLGFSELLTTGIEGQLSADQLEMVGTIHRTGKDLLQQIDDILDTAKIEAGRMELHREPTPPANLIARAIQRARLRVSGPIEFDTTFAAGLPPAFVDPYRTTQALENVLLFAAEGLQHGTIEISCEARRAHSGRDIVIRISSPRALVPLAELEQARRGFFRLPGHTGLGLGLPIATSILEQQGGALDIQHGSSSSLGARAAMGFELRLPALSARRGLRLRPG